MKPTYRLELRLDARTAAVLEELAAESTVSATIRRLILDAATPRPATEATAPKPADTVRATPKL